jgi:NADP-dependent 3-hydroxy acid dehydrogenase YdfG
LADFIKSKESVSNWLRIKKKFTKINLVLAAGYLGKPCINDEEFDLNDWLISYQINLLGNLAILNGVLPEMKVLNNSKVIFFSGGGAAYGYPLFPSYSASKTAIVRTVENLSMIYKNYNFIFVALAPGANKTDMLKEVIKYGGEVKTTVEIEEPFTVVKNILTNKIIS